MDRRNEIPEIMLLGMSHKTAPLEVREKFFFDGMVLKSFQEKAHGCGIDEMVYLATCNRVEIYCTACDIHSAIEKLIDLLEEVSRMPRKMFSRHIYQKFSKDAVRHLLAVASSLDSMVIGESEILGQIKQAYRDSVLSKNSGIMLNRLFHQSFNTSKKVRTRTSISRNPLSLAYIAVDMARTMFEGDLSGCKALLIGAGEMGELILKYLTKNRIKQITIANRSLDNAEMVVERTNKQADIIPMENIVAVAELSDIIIMSITCHSHLLTYKIIRELMEKREGRPLFIIDIGVPRNVDPEIHAIKNVSLYNIDDLKDMADKNLKNRLAEVENAMNIVHSDANDFYEWYEGLEVVPMIVRIRENFERIREREFEKYRRRQFKHMSVNELAQIENLTQQIISKILHNPIMAIKQNKIQQLRGYGDQEGIIQKIRIIEELFKL